MGQGPRRPAGPRRREGARPLSARAERKLASLALALALACAPSGPDRRPPVARGDDLPGEVVVRLAPGVSSAELEALAERAGAYAVAPTRLGGWWRLAIDRARDPRAVAAELAARPELEAAAPNQRRVPFRRPDDPRYPEQWAHAQVHAEGGWDREIGDPSVLVAIIGTGVAYEHQELRANLFVNPREVPRNEVDDDGNGLVDDVSGWDFAEADADARPTLSERPSFEERMEAAHETMVAGVALASGNSGVGIAGAAWDASFVPIRFDYTTVGSAEAIDYARSLGARIANLSYGSVTPGEDGRDPLEEDAVLRAEAAGMLVVASAGNSGVGDAHYPAAYPTVLSVGATRRDGARAEFSSYGPTVDLAAPGEEVLTTFLGGSYLEASGTSFAAPYVAGAAALLASRHPGWTPEELRRTLIYEGEKLYTDHDIGTRLDVARALAAEQPARAYARFVRPSASASFSRGGVARFEGYALGDRFTLDAQPALGGDFFPLAAGTSTAGLIARFDTSALALGEYRVRLRAVAGAEVDVDWIRLRITTGALPGFPALVGLEATAPATLGDLDGDGRPELIAPMRGAAGPELHVLRADATELPGWPRPLTADASTVPVLADLEGDGALELSVGTEAGVESFRSDGAAGPLFPAMDRVEGLLAVDLDADERPELVASAGALLWALRGDGGALGGWPLSLEPGLGAPIAGDLDGDGAIEIGVLGERLLHLVRASGAAVLGRPLFVPGAPGATLIGADLDGDGSVELLIARDRLRAGRVGTPEAWTRELHALGLDGLERRGFPFLEARDPVVALERPLLVAGDLDGDGLPELVADAGSGELYALRADGAPLPRWPVSAATRAFSQGAIGDVDGDGRSDLLAASLEEGRLMGIDASARPALGFPLTTQGGRVGGPLITDLDGDGGADVVLSGHGVEVYRLDRSFDPALGEWALPRRDAAATGVLPPRFALSATATGPRELHLEWASPRGPRALSYRVQLDRRVVAITAALGAELALEEPRRPRELRVLAFDGAGQLIARSVELTVRPEAAWCEGREGRACDDGDPCTLDDLCAGGRCGGASASPDGTRCDDGDACTLDDACASGRCGGRGRVECPSIPGSCARELCEPSSGRCVAAPRADGEACDDGEPCTVRDVCHLGVCRGDEAATDGTSCDDGNPCTAVGVCRGGACEGAFPLAPDSPCDDGNGCTAPGRCDGDRCVGEAPVADGTPCDDADLCTTGERCREGACARGAPVACHEPSACVVGSSCDPRTGACRVRAFPDLTPCDDGDACTAWDVCDEGACEGRAPRACDEGQSCDPLSGACVAPEAPAGGDGCSAAGATPLSLLVALGLLGRRRRRDERRRRELGLE